MLRFLVLVGLTAGVVAVFVPAGSAQFEGCPPGWDAKPTSDHPSLFEPHDRNGDEVVCVPRAQEGNPNEPPPRIVIDNTAPDPFPGQAPFQPGCDPGTRCPPE